MSRFSQWFRARRRTRQAPLHLARPRLESLEHRNLLAAGALDSAFGTLGRVTVAFGSINAANAVAIDASDRVVLAGWVGSGSSSNFAVARLNPNGTPDTSFGTAGTGRVTVDFNGLSDVATSVAIDAMGRIVVAGYANVGTTSGQDFAVASLTAEGVLDAAFGINGKATLGLDLGGDKQDYVSGMGIDGLGRIVLVGSTRVGATDSDLAATRLTTGGMLDTTFGTNGWTVIGSTAVANDIFIEDMAFDGMDRIVLAGIARDSIPGPKDFLIARLGANGGLDTTFGTSGSTRIAFNIGGSNEDGAAAVALQSDGRIVAAGYAQFGVTDFDFALVRLNSDGSPDTSFDLDGKRTIPFDLGGGLLDQAYDVAIDANGQIVAAGRAERTSTDFDFALTRLNPDGSLDANFGSNGKVTTNFNSLEDTANASALQADGRIVLAGFASTGTGVFDMAAARFEADTIRFSSAAYSVIENAGQAIITLIRSGGVTGTVSARLTTTDGTATAGPDYTAVDRTIDFFPNQTSAIVTFPIVDDLLDEGNETVNVALSDPNAAALGVPNSAILTILDRGSIAGTKFNDLDGDRMRDPGDPGLANWTIFLDLDNNGVRDQRTSTVNAILIDPLPIPDSSTVYSSLPVSTLVGDLIDLDVSLAIEHPYDADLDVFLISPQGTRVELFSDIGSDGDNFFGTILDDEAISPISAGSPPFTGRFRPFGMLSGFDGQRTDGVWRLEITDDAAQDIGRLIAWSLTFTYTEPTALTNPAGNYSFINLPPGTTYVVREVQQAGWVQTAPAGDTHMIPLGGGQHIIGRDFGNRRDTLIVASTTPTVTGFTTVFNQPIDPSVLSLYDTATGGLGAADAELIGTATGMVHGSLVLNPTATGFTFLATGGVLLPDSYTVFFRSAANGFRTPAGSLLDGNADGTPGDPHTTSFVVAPSAAVVVGMPDFARGPGQLVDVPATSASNDLPLRLSNGADVTEINLTLHYDPALLNITGASVGPSVPEGARVTFTVTTLGTAEIRFSSPVSLREGAIDFARLAAQVPTDAPYGSKHILDIAELRVVDVRGRVVSSADDDALHVVGYFGDTSGNGTYSSADAQRALRVAVGLDSGFAAYQLADPVILADITGNGFVNATDATRILQEAVGLDRPEIPALPGGITITPSGPDPLLSIPTHFMGRRGRTFVVPVNLDPSDGLEAVDLALSYDASRLEIVGAAGVRRGRLTRDFDLFAVNHDAVAGTIRVSLARLVGPISGRGSGSVLLLTFRIRADAPPGAAVINLRHDLGSTFTQLNEGGLVLTPAPDNAAEDVLDGLVTVRERRRRFVDAVFASMSDGELPRLHRRGVRRPAGR